MGKIKMEVLVERCDQQISIIRDDTLEEILKSDPLSIVLIDTREQTDYTSGHILTSINIEKLHDKIKVENNFESYDSKLFFRQREYLPVVLYGGVFPEFIFDLYKILKEENLAKQVFMLSQDYETFSIAYPQFCSSTPRNNKMVIHTTIEERRKLAHNKLFKNFGRQITCDDPSKILDFLYLGNAQNALSKTQLQKLDIGYILNTARECRNHFLKDFEYQKYSFVDDDSEEILVYFSVCIDFIEKARKNNSKILVHCFMGMSRSAAIVVAYLMSQNGWNLKKAYQFVNNARPIMDIVSDQFVLILEFRIHETITGI
jgi:protein-tyrosine phosphatase